MPDLKLGPSGSEVTLPMAKVYPVRAVDFGSQRRTAGGVLKTVWAKQLKRWNLEWVGLTEAEKDTLWARYTAGTVQNFSPPDEDDGTAGYYSVHPLFGTWDEEAQTIADGTIYAIKMGLVEQE